MSRVAVLLLASLAPALPARAALPMGRAHCDPAAFARLPRLLLVGENHCSPGSDAVKAEAVRLGAEGLVFTALEVGVRRAAYPWDAERLHRDFAVGRTAASRVYGIESPFPHGLVLSYIYASGRHGSCGGPLGRTALEGFLDYGRINPYLRRSWEEARAGMAGPLDAAQEELARRIDAALSGTSRLAARPEDARTFTALARRVNARYAALAGASLRAGLGLARPPAATPLEAPASLADVAGAAAWNEALDDQELLTMDVRDRDLGENIADVYCAAAREGRHVVAGVGAAHLPGVASLLKTWSGGRIPLETAESWGKGEAQPLLARLASLPAEPLAVPPASSAAERVREALRSVLPRGFDAGR